MTNDKKITLELTEDTRKKFNELVYYTKTKEGKSSQSQMAEKIIKEYINKKAEEDEIFKKRLELIQ